MNRIHCINRAALSAILAAALVPALAAALVLAAAPLSAAPAASSAQLAVSFPRPKMIRVQGGTFFMGSNEASFKFTERVHEVTLRTFLLSETEVTQELYTAVMNENPSFFKGDKLPVDSVSWLDAVLFCNALSALSGIAPAYTVEGDTVSWNRESAGYRLPTEAEWEFAARGGNAGTSGTILDKAYFSGGDSIANAADYCWYSLNSKTGGRLSTQPVASKLPNQLGLYDMSGNVWEWCWDWYGDYPAQPVSNYAGIDGGKNRVYRGGAYINNFNQLRTTFRIWEAPSFKYRTMGFRMAQNG